MVLRLRSGNGPAWFMPQHLKVSAGCGTPLAPGCQDDWDTFSLPDATADNVSPRLHRGDSKQTDEPTFRQAYQGQFVSLTTGQVYDRFDR